MKEILQLIVEVIQGLNNIMVPTFQKQWRILELIVEFSFRTFILNLKSDDSIFQLLQNVYTKIT